MSGGRCKGGGVDVGHERVEHVHELPPLGGLLFADKASQASGFGVEVLGLRCCKGLGCEVLGEGVEHVKNFRPCEA